MSKIIQAANVMISRKDLITDVTMGSNEIFFLYNKKYSWSIAYREDDVFLWFYPNQSLENLVARSNQHEWEGVEMVAYKASDIGTREGMETFVELFRVVKEKQFGVDAVLDDIINDDPF